MMMTNLRFWWQSAIDLIILLATFFRFVDDFLRWKIGHLYPKSVTNNSNLSSTTARVKMRFAIRNNQSFLPHLSPVPDIRSPLMTDVLEWLTKKIFESPWTCWSQFTVCVDFKVIATLLRLECVFLICLRKWQNIEINEKKWYLGFWMRIEPQKIK